MKFILTFLVTASLALAYDPPIGIPEPLWGAFSPIDEVCPALPATWTSNQAGYYYVQTGGVNAGQGYPGSARGTLPTSPPAGSIVVVDGTFTGSLYNPNTVRIGGTEESPCWLVTMRGTMTVDAGTNVITTNIAHAQSVNDKVRFFGSTLPGGITQWNALTRTDYYVLSTPSSTTMTISATLGGAELDITSAGSGTMRWQDASANFNNGFTIGPLSTYLVCDGFHLDFTSDDQAEMEVGVNYVCIRYFTAQGVGEIDGTGTAGGDHTNIWQIQPPSSDYDTSNLVFYQCHITRAGDNLYASGDPDACCISIGSKFIQDVWVLDSELSYSSGPCVIVGAGSIDTTPDTDIDRRIYIGRNLVHHSGQDCLWSKRAEDVIMSENTCHSARRDSPSSPNAAGLGAQYGPRYMWCIYNRVYNCQAGFKAGSGSASQTDFYVIGNLFHDIHDEDGDLEENWRTNQFTQDGVAITSQGAKVHVVHNTIYDYDAGIVIATDSATPTVYGNIFASRAGSLGTDMNLDDSGGTGTVQYNIFTSPYIQIAGSLSDTIAEINASKGPGNIDTAPTFTNAGAADFTLAAASAGIDAAEASAHAVYATFSTRYSRSIEVDHAGTARPQNTTWDMGAYEYVSGGGGGGASSITVLGTFNITGAP